MLSFVPTTFQGEVTMAYHSSRLARDFEPPLRASKRARLFMNDNATQKSRQQASLAPEEATTPWLPFAEERSSSVTRKRTLPSDTPLDYLKRPRTPATTAYLEEGSQFAIVPHLGTQLVSRNLIDPTPSNDLAIVPYVAPFSGPLYVSRCTIEQLDSDSDENDGDDASMDIES